MSAEGSPVSAPAYDTQRACPICAGHRATALHEQRFVLPEDSPLPSAYTVAACERCGACFADTPAAQAAYDRHYEHFSKYDDPALGTGGGSSVDDKERLDETAALIARLPSPRGKASRILDIGCAGGGLLQSLAALGFRDLAGIDPSPACVERVRRLGFACHQGKISDLRRVSALDASYDVVVLSHVVEHLVDVRAALSAVRDLLSADGVCYVEVPDADRYSTREFVPLYFLDSEHINHFNRAALQNLGWVNGFDVVSSGTKDLRLAGGKRYPAAYACFGKGSFGRQPVRDGALPTALSAYIEDSKRALDPRELDELAASRRPVLLWGAGSHAQRMLETSSLGRCNLIGVVDRDPGKQGRSLLGHRIANPESALEDLDADVTIVIASVLHGHEIAASIADAGLPNPLVVAS
jgi:SAM-dependent methyltransferase